MTFSEAGERESTPEVKEEKTKEIGETKTETREVDEKADLVNNAHDKPDEMIERGGNIEEAEATQKALEKVLEAPVAFVDQAVEAGAAKPEQSGGDVAIDTVPLPEKPETAEDGGEVAIDTVPLPETPAEEGSQSRAEDAGDVKIDTVPLPDEQLEGEAPTGRDPGGVKIDTLPLPDEQLEAETTAGIEAERDVIPSTVPLSEKPLEEESTPHPEGGDPTTKGAKPTEFYSTKTSPFDQPVVQEGIMQPSGEGEVFDEDKTIPITLEQALKKRLDPWINWGDGSQETGGSLMK